MHAQVFFVSGPDGTCYRWRQLARATRLALRFRRPFGPKPQPLCVGSQNAVFATRDSPGISNSIRQECIFFQNKKQDSRQPLLNRMLLDTSAEQQIYLYSISLHAACADGNVLIYPSLIGDLNFKVTRFMVL